MRSLLVNVDVRVLDELPDTAVDGAGVLLCGLRDGPLDPDQAWFWTPEWQDKEHEAEADKPRGTLITSRPMRRS